ncbi:hypothetical protein [uncultured Sphingomonas sp.]|uniref:hypothetical protein n=1 Tax=uncultured Sphingomonas sp. TaxID=158754 RepID=UPI0025F2BE88|nr:hypothetical protein [uncultured Sphingomonas sp.]
MSDDDLITTIAAAQRAPAEDYILWAETGDGGEITLQTVRLPLGFSAEVSLDRVRTEARKSLALAGFRGADADVARLHLDRLPTAEEIRAILDPMVSAGEEMTFLDFTYWESARRRLHLEPKPAEFGGEPELNYDGLRIQRSAAS